VRAVIVEAGRLLLVNAYPGRASDLWCAPGGGVEPGASLADNLRREVGEETGLAITVGPPCLVNEFHEPTRGFHQVEIFFRCRLVTGGPPVSGAPGGPDPAGVVDRLIWASETEMAGLRFKPDSLAEIAWADGLRYDPLERLQR
jgi:ADP-ribose pyrophosphatase YjhB (NUDIX family)